MNKRVLNRLKAGNALQIDGIFPYIRYDVCYPKKYVEISITRLDKCIELWAFATINWYGVKCVTKNGIWKEIL